MKKGGGGATGLEKNGVGAKISMWGGGKKKKVFTRGGGKKPVSCKWPGNAVRKKKVKEGVFF